MTIKLNPNINRENERLCAVCKVWQSRENFLNKKQGNKVYCGSLCKPCRLAASRKYNAKSWVKQKNLRETAVRLGLCRMCRTNPISEGTRSCTPCRDYMKEWHKRDTGKHKQLVFQHYGKRCACCGESKQEFLSVDHIGGWGKDHKFSNGKGTRMTGVHLYRWIVKNNFPDTLRLLCMNCNTALGIYGYCPHELERSQGGQPATIIGNAFLERRFLHIN